MWKIIELINRISPVNRPIIHDLFLINKFTFLTSFAENYFYYLGTQIN